MSNESQNFLFTLLHWIEGALEKIVPFWISLLYSKRMMPAVCDDVNMRGWWVIDNTADSFIYLSKIEIILFRAFSFFAYKQRKLSFWTNRKREIFGRRIVRSESPVYIRLASKWLCFVCGFSRACEKYTNIINFSETKANCNPQCNCL